MARQDFIDQLKEMKFVVEDKGENKLCFKYTVPIGRFIGQEIMLGFTVDDQFPASPPSGPHISPQLLPINTSGPHPNGSIHLSPAPNQFGDGWEYWSRPFKNWPSTDRTVKTYMKHIANLFATQA
jgi:hypothetical protein